MTVLTHHSFTLFHSDYDIHSIASIILASICTCHYNSYWVFPCLSKTWRPFGVNTKTPLLEQIGIPISSVLDKAYIHEMLAHRLCFCRPDHYPSDQEFFFLLESALYCIPSSLYYGTYTYFTVILCRTSYMKSIYVHHLRDACDTCT